MLSTQVVAAKSAAMTAQPAAGLVAAGLAGDLKEGVAMGAEATDSGQAAATLEKLRRFGAKHSVVH